MQVERGINKWAGRVPPLDLSTVTVCPRETEHRWNKMQPPQQKPMKKTTVTKRGADGLPIGKRTSYKTYFGHARSIYKNKN